MDLRLLVLQGKPEGKEIPIRVPTFLIGRSAECQLRPNSELISRQHCQFTIDGDVVRVRDMGSSNGTIVNGERLTEEATVNDGDLIQVGPLAFQVILQKDAAATPAPSAAPAVNSVRVDSVLAAVTPVAPPPVALPIPAAVAAAAAAPAVTGKLRDKEAKSDDIDHWLMSDNRNKVPDSGSGVYAGDTQMLQIEALQDTAAGLKSADETTPPDGVKKPEEEDADKIVELEGGVRLKLKSEKLKIEKTPEDTSRAAADIIRRMMERRPDK